MNVANPPSLPIPGSFRAYLQGEIVRRCKANPRYSLRAFAKSLGIDSSSLSQILKGSRAVTPNLVRKLGTRLCLSPEELEQYLPLKRKRGARAAPAAETNLTIEVYHLIADWYHYAIFELVTVRGFRRDPRWIARRLGITPAEAHIALERLLRLELVVARADGSLAQGTSFITTVGNPFTDVALRKSQAQILALSAKALEEVPLERRDHSGTCMAIHTRRIPEAKEMIKRFRRELCDHLQQDLDRDAVYQLGVSFYPLTLEEKGKEK
jgi:plasmid maintenance system antidote protein VapI